MQFNETGYNRSCKHFFNLVILNLFTCYWQLFRFISIIFSQNFCLGFFQNIWKLLVRPDDKLILNLIWARGRRNKGKGSAPPPKFWQLQAFLDFRGFNFRDFQFTTVYNSILFSSPLVLLSNLDFCGFCFRIFFCVPTLTV